MRKFRDALQLIRNRVANLRKVAVSQGISRDAITNYLTHFDVARLPRLLKTNPFKKIADLGFVQLVQLYIVAVGAYWETSR